MPESDEYMFFVGVYKDLLQDGEWPIAGHRKFMTEEESWAPPQCVVDAITTWEQSIRKPMNPNEVLNHENDSKKHRA